MTQGPPTHQRTFRPITSASSSSSSSSYKASTYGLRRKRNGHSLAFRQKDVGGKNKIKTKLSYVVKSVFLCFFESSFPRPFLANGIPSLPIFFPSNVPRGNSDWHPTPDSSLLRPLYLPRPSLTPFSHTHCSTTLLRYKCEVEFSNLERTAAAGAEKNEGIWINQYSPFCTGVVPSNIQMLFGLLRP